MLPSFYQTVRRALVQLALVSVCLGFTYIATQQTLRQSANDPQIQLAEDVANRLTQGTSAQNLLPSDSVEISHSLAPYIMFAEAGGNITTSSGMLDGQIPTLPNGLLHNVKQETRVTWQPRPGIRQALVIVHVSGTSTQFVIAGRSLREVERKVDQLNVFGLAAWCAALLIIIANATLARRPE